jgi:hypothetical protein
VSLAQSRANYLIAQYRLQQQFAKALQRALVEAVDSGSVTDALLINKTIHRLNAGDVNPLNFASHYP